MVIRDVTKSQRFWATFNFELLTGFKLMSKYFRNKNETVMFIGWAIVSWPGLGNEHASFILTSSFILRINLRGLVVRAATTLV